MPTPRRNFEDFHFYHIYNRGNHREAVYHDARDYEKFLWMLRDAAAEHSVTVAAYCLMPNHFHLLLRQDGRGSIQKCMTSLALGYVKYYNKHYGQVGHIFQGRYRDRYVRDNADLMNLSRYIHLNPVGIRGIDEYEWSSYRAYLGEPNRFCDPSAVMRLTDIGPHNYAIFCNSRKNSELPGGQATE